MDKMELGPRCGFSGDKGFSKESLVEKDVETESSDLSQEKTKQSLLTKTLKAKLQEAWVQCEKPDCLKWRTISKVGAKALGDEPWFCYMNENLRYSSCDVPEEDTYEAEEMVERCRLVYIRSILPVGSLVWAKMPGYCWWPGMVIVDGNYEVAVTVDCDGDPLSYHIEFLGPKRSRAWIPEHLVEIYGKHVPFDPSSGRQEKTSGNDRTIFKGISVKEAVEEADSFQMLTLRERLSISHFQPHAPVAGSSSKSDRDDRKKRKRQSPARDYSPTDKAACSKTKRPGKQINSQCDNKKRKKKAELATGTKLPRKDVANEKSGSDAKPASKIQRLINGEKSEKFSDGSVGDDEQPSEERSRSSETIASVENEHSSLVTGNDDLEDSDYFQDSRAVPDVDDVQKPAEADSVQKSDAKWPSKMKPGKSPLTAEADSVQKISMDAKPTGKGKPGIKSSFIAEADSVQKISLEAKSTSKGKPGIKSSFIAEADSVQKMDAKPTSKGKPGIKSSFTVPNSGSSKPLENKANNGTKKGFCPPVKTSRLENSSAGTLNHLKSKTSENKETRQTASREDQIIERDESAHGCSGQVMERDEGVHGCSGQSVSEAEVNEEEAAGLSGDEEASAFDELADEICSVAQEEGHGLQQLLGQSASLVGRTKEEKYTIDVQTYKENHDRFKEDVHKFMSENKQRMQKLPVWENRCIGLFELFLAIHDRGGYDEVCQKRLWTEIYSELTGITASKPNPKTKNYYKRYLLPYELYIDGREYKHLFTKAETGREPKRAKVPSKSSGNKDKASVQHGKKSEAAREQRKAKPLQPEAGDDAESESAELERLMLDLKEYDTLCQSQVSACLQHDVTSKINSTTPKRKLTSTPAKKPVDKDEEDSFLCDMEEDPLLNDNDDDAHIVPLACTLSPVFSSDREGSCELQELEALKHELISMQEHLDEMNNSSLL